MKKILILGSQGMVGSRFIDMLRGKFSFQAPSQDDLDITKVDDLRSYIDRNIPDLIINFSAFTNVKESQDQENDKTGLVYMINAKAVSDLSDIALKSNIKLIQISTEYVFDGSKSDSPYTEEDKPNPKNWYGKTKYYGEEFIRMSGCKFLIVRISMPFCASFNLKKDLVRTFIEKLKNKNEIHAVTDSKITPISIDDLVYSLEVLINADKSGIYHIVPPDYTTPYDFVNLIADEFNLDKSNIFETTFNEYTKEGNKLLLQYSWLSSKKFREEFETLNLKSIAESIKILKDHIINPGLT